MGRVGKRLTQTQMIVIGYVLIIAAGTFLLILPVSTREGIFTSPVDALFTATSASCVTGLVIADTFQHWSMFGQTVILTLIQIGGLGLYDNRRLLRDRPAQKNWTLDKRDTTGKCQYYASRRNCQAC